MANLGATIRKERQARGLTLQDMSQMTGIAVPNLSRIERSGSAIRSDTLVRIADALGAEIAFVPRRQSVTLDEAIVRSLDGQRAVRDAGLTASDPRERLRRKAARGLDVSVESEAIAQYR